MGRISKMKIARKVIGDENAYKLKKAMQFIYLKKNAPELLKSWMENGRFKNTNMGKRCFILGNGPSLKDVPLEMLEEEYVFSVNNFSMVNDYKKAQTNVHLWMDLSFFDMRDDQKYDMQMIMENYKKIAEENPICFVPSEAYDFVKNNRLDEILDINYLFIERDMDKEYKAIDLRDYIYSGTTVVQYAIQVAVYMGFKEIYLLGCDTTNIVSVINVMLEQDNSKMHAYDNDDVDKRYREMLEVWKSSDVFYDQYRLFLGYERLDSFCEKKDIKLYNCSTKTLINGIKRKPLSDVLK